jgi:fluoride exporter
LFYNDPMIFGVMVGGALGALCRYWINMSVAMFFGNKLLFPWATFGINITGSFILSFLFFANYFNISNSWRVALGTGFLGAFTTFSTFELESLQLLDKGQIWLTTFYIVGSVVTGFLAAVLGRYVALRVLS